MTNTLPGSVPPLALSVPGEVDGPGEGVGEHVEDGELDVGDEDPLLRALLLDVPEVRHPLQGPGCQHRVELLLVRQPECLRPNKLWISLFLQSFSFCSCSV